MKCRIAGLSAVSVRVIAPIDSSSAPSRSGGIARNGAAGVRGSGASATSTLRDDIFAAVTYCPINILMAPHRLDIGSLIRAVERLLPDPADRAKRWWETPRRWLGF